jgi:ArsR family transcriptional regulator
VCHMEATLGLRQSYISQHLMVLREAGLVEDRREGWNVFYRLTRPEIRRLTEALGVLSKGRQSRLRHVHAAGDCPCPKCSTRRRTRYIPRARPS